MHNGYILLLLECGEVLIGGTEMVSFMDIFSKESF